MLPAFAAAVLLVAGCVNMTPERAQPLRSPGVPFSSYLVHGSREHLSYTAEEPGTVYLVEGRTRTPMGQLWLDAGEAYEIAFDDTIINYIAARVNVQPGEVTPFLYFVPDDAASGGGGGGGGGGD